MLNSGTLAQRAGVNKQTIRYYERIGLIEAAPRNESGYRVYTEAVVDRIRFIQSAKDLGFQLAEIQELLSLRIDRRSNCDRVREKAFGKREEVRRKIRDLKSLDRVLGGLIGSCDARQPTDACPILAALDTKSKSRT
ncbi:MAG: heavy metal-responsive transcriptional regulator [Leptospirales bacterium]|jgi:Hg(II)-responsive transcriptional regulator